MITIFNRKLAFSTMDMEKYANARDDLKNAGIDFRVDCKGQTDRHTISRTHNMVSFGMRTKVSSGMIYNLYVHEKDYNRAIAVIRRR
ncbi:MAG: hypothetical protein IJ410_05865 [Oscillospiraceae bacterium]|nr:hypothetical protein [Oscillospiraceae bacterium]